MGLTKRLQNTYKKKFYKLLNLFSGFQIFFFTCNEVIAMDNVSWASVHNYIVHN
jgi:hypothetical protein